LQRAFVTLAIVLFAATIASAQIGGPLPSAEDVVARMMQFDAQRQSELTGYTALRHYAAGNKSRRAEMLVRVTCDSRGAKQFSILSEEGSGSIRKRVFHKLLSEETEASRHETRNSTRLTPANYDFQFVGQEKLETGPIPSFGSKASLHEILPSGYARFISCTPTREWGRSGSLRQPTQQARSGSSEARN
jgi:hypothetical protein